MNFYDSDRMADILLPHGFEATDQLEEADIIILNTCHIREKATEKVYSELGRLNLLKQERAAQGKSTVVAVAGCVAQAEGEEILRRAPYVDLVFGPQTYHHLLEMLAQAARRSSSTEGPGRGIINIDFPEEPKFDFISQAPNPEGVSAFLTIQEGCDKFCHFCCVPYTRGAEFSRPAAAILAEAHALVDKGVREITLLGQNVNAYHGLDVSGTHEWGLGRLMGELAEIEGLRRIRYMTSHPRDVDEELIAAHRDVAKVMPFLHLPVQSGSDRILKAMNRRHTSDEYRTIIARLRAARPDIAFSSDFIVGYPGETEEDFQETLRLVRDIGYAQAYSFKYSRRPGTPAAALNDQIPEQVKDERLEALQALLREQQTAFNQSCVNTVQPILFEKKGRHAGQIIGRTPYMQSVHVKAPERLIGQIVDVRVTGIAPNSLIAEVVINSEKAD